MEIQADRIPKLIAEPQQPEQDTAPRAQIILFWSAAAVAALCIDFGAFHRLHNSDSIVPVMMSLYRWTPFYWEQDRFGMLVPLLAIPFKSPLANLLVQSAINAFCGLAAFFLCARYVIPKAWLFTGALSASLFLLFNSVDARFLYLGLSQPYGVGMFLGFAGLLLLENSKYPRGPRIIASFLFLLAASWVDAAVMFVLLPVIFFRWYFNRDARRRSARFDGLLNLEVGIAMVLVFLSFVASYVYSGIVSYSAAYGDWPYPPVPPWRWPAVWFQFGGTIWTDYLNQPWGISVAALLVLGAIVRLATRGGIRRTNFPAANLVASSLASFLMMGSLSHIQNADYDPRFGLQSMVLLQIGAVVWALSPFYSLANFTGRRALTAASLILFLSTPLYLYGRPSLARVRADLDETLGEYTLEILQSDATHIAGDYWKVWPATFHANLTLYKMGSSRKLWAVTYRSTPTRIFWSQIPREKMRFATIAGDSSVSDALNLYSLAPVATEQTFKNIVILKPVPTTEKSQKQLSK
ncbi:MAG: hypothetical protein WBF35_00030 [Candidatus Acidiferrales bacterium]